MKDFDRKFLVCGFVFGALGMLLGIVMAATHNHSQHVTHAHIMLLGFVLSFLYATLHKLWLDDGVSLLKTIQFLAHQLGTLVIAGGLFVLYGGMIDPPKVEPFLKVASVTILVALLMGLWLLLSARRA